MGWVHGVWESWEWYMEFSMNEKYKMVSRTPMPIYTSDSGNPP